VSCRRKRCGFPGEPIELTEKQWAEIVRLSGLPSETRLLIGKTIALFRNVQKTAGRHTARQTRDELKKLQKDALALHRSLFKLMANPHAHYAVTVPSVPPGGWPPSTVPEPRNQAQRRLETSLDALQHLASWLALASDRVEPMRPGANRKAENVHWLLGMIGSIFERFTDKKISRSNKTTNTSREFLTTVLRIADPKIQPGTIERAMQSYITFRERVQKRRSQRHAGPR
jgi:hypothetical protein